MLINQHGYILHSAILALNDLAASENKLLSKKKICQHLRHSTQYVPDSDNIHKNMLPICGKHSLTTGTGQGSAQKDD